MPHDLAGLYEARREGLELWFASRLPDATEAPDFTQRAFERLLGVEGRIEDPDAYLTTIASHLLRNAYRDAGRRPRDLSWEELVGDGTGLDHLPQFQTYDFEDSKFAEAHDVAVRGLASEPRDAYILGELRGLPSREAGPVLGVSHTTAAARRDAATAEIRKELAQ